MGYDYKTMLERAYELLPERGEEKERFSYEKPNIIYQANQIVIPNFIQFCNSIHRDPNHVSKFLFRQLACSGKIEGNRLILHTRSKLIERKIQEYLEKYLYCRECKRPDTRLIKEDRFLILKCDACGAKRVVEG